MNTKQIREMKIMSPGEITDTNGRVSNWTTEQFKQIAAKYSYNGAEQAAAVVLTHNTEGAARYGWIDSVTVGADGCLYCSAQVEPALYSDMTEGRRPNRSICVYPDTLEIGHLAILGAEKPAFSDLGLAKYSAPKDKGTPAMYSVFVDIAEERDLRDLTKKLTDFIETQTALNSTIISSLQLLVQQKSEYCEPKKTGVEIPAPQTQNLPDNKDNANKDALKYSQEALKKVIDILGEPLPKSTGGKNTGALTAREIESRALMYQKKRSDEGVIIDFKTAAGAVMEGKA